MTRVPAVAARALLVLVGLSLFVAVGEAALRVVYRDAGTRTLGGPGGEPFDHWTTDGIHRGRLDTGPKTPGVPRVMVLGDSITYGLGVQDWKATWPELLAQALARDGRPHEFAVLAVPGNDMPQHLDTMRAWIDRVQPETIVYQWYVNDVEAISHRPDLAQPWQRLPWHHALRSWSYLYYVFDHRLAQLLSRPHRSYVDYLRTDFVPGTMEWTEFEREFHEFATLGMRAARRIMVLYPQVPFRESYPLQGLHDRMRHLAGPHDLELPVLTWVRSAGAVVSVPGSRWGQGVRAQPDSGALQVQSADYVFAPGRVELKASIASSGAGNEVGRVDLIDIVADRVVATGLLTLPAGATSGEATAAVTVPGDRPARLAVRITSRTHLTLTNIAMPVDYGFEVIDLRDRLNTFNTHASSFDAHPNERAHEVMAEMIYAAMRVSRAGGVRDSTR